ncbi:MAG: recombinase family protein [Oscillospiraceae bacterium]|nr:recombinase family protein [Oscillospiraceae bacterium]
MHTSRLWRDEQAKVLITREIRKLNGEIISIEQPRYSLYTKDPQDFLYNSMMEMLDTYERMCISMKLAKGRATKARKGEKPTGVAPYGYMYSADKKHITVHPTEAEVIKRISKMAQHGESLNRIADTLNSEGMRMTEKA